MDAQNMIALLIGLAIGILVLRTWGPFRMKEKADAAKGKTPRDFDWTYLATAIAAFVGAAGSAVVMLPEAMAAAPTTINGIGLVVFGVFYGAGWNEGFNRYILPWFTKPTPEP